MDEVSLREHFESLMAEADRRNEQRFQAQEKAVNAALIAAKEAVEKAERAAERRFESVNEFREQLADQANTFLPRAEYNVQHQALGEKVDAVAKTLSDRIDQNTALVNQSLTSLNLSRAGTQGRALGVNAAWGYLLGAVGLIGAVIAIVIKLH